MGCLKLTYREELPQLKVVKRDFSVNKNSCAGSYRYGFNGAEKDSEINNVEGSNYDLGLRQYEARIGRMFSVDPRSTEYPWQSSYVYHRNSPISMLDYLGGGDPEGDKQTKKKAETDPETGVLTTARDNLSLNSIPAGKMADLEGQPNVHKVSVLEEYINSPIMTGTNGAKAPNGLATGSATPVYPGFYLIPLAPALSTSSKLLNFAVNIMTNAKTGGGAVFAIKGVDDITESVIRDVMSTAPLTTTQMAVSVPMVKRYYQMLKNGNVAPAISVTDAGAIVEGNHRYIAGMLYGKIPSIKAGTQSAVNAAKPIKKWSDIKLDKIDWEPPR